MSQHQDPVTSARARTTFAVSDVRPADAPLPEVPYKQAVEAPLAVAPHAERRHQFLAKALREQGEAVPPPPARGRPVEACSRYHGRLVAGVAYHPLVAAVHLAFTDHRPLCLSPDMVWLLICQGVANHVNANAESLRPRLVAHPGKATIVVRRDDFVKGSPENPWAEVFGEFAAAVRDHIGPSHDLFLPRFSTTGPVERAAAQVVLLDAVQSYFSYECHSLCGIPAVTLEGTPADWQAVADGAAAFAEFGLGWWTTPLQRVLRQFVAAAQGSADPAFWRSIYKENDQSGGPVITGWITAFFPYVKDGWSGRATRRCPWFPADAAGDSGLLEQILYPDPGRSEGFARGLTTEAFPGGLAGAPFLWKFPYTEFAMEFLGGFVGVAQGPDSLCLRPEVGWAVREAVGG
jgi:hypothetical protein